MVVTCCTRGHTKKTESQIYQNTSQSPFIFSCKCLLVIMAQLYNSFQVSLHSVVFDLQQAKLYCASSHHLTNHVT